MKRDDPDAEMIRAHLIAGIKHAETPHLAKYKCRVVVNGTNVRDAWGQQVVPSDLHTMPLTFASARAIGALSLVNDAGSSATDNDPMICVQFDVVGAYLQAPRLPGSAARWVLSDDGRTDHKLSCSSGSFGRNYIW